MPLSDPSNGLPADPKQDHVFFMFLSFNTPSVGIQRILISPGTDRPHNNLSNVFGLV
jgi:hypothetical protein